MLCKKFFFREANKMIAFRQNRIVKWNVILLLAHYVWCCQSTNVKCKVSHDHNYNGDFVDCSNSDLSAEDLRKLNFENATTLILNQNYNLGTLPNNFFTKFKHLKRLEMNRCGMTTIEVNALKGLTELEILDLSQNHLSIKEYKFPKGFFSHVPHLKKLFIHDNDNSGRSNEYSKYIDIFRYLHNLTDLSIDSFSNLRIGEEFLIFTKLINLMVCSPSFIANDSLEGFENSSIKQFELKGGNLDTQIGVDVFQYLPNVSRLIFDHIRIGNQNALRMMKPLSERRMEMIMFNGIYHSHFVSLDKKVQDCIITANGMRHLGSIALAEFYWYNSHIMSIETDAFLTHKWMHNLRTLSFTMRTMVLGDNIILYKSMLMKKLETFLATDEKNTLIDQFWKQKEDQTANVHKHTAYFIDNDKRRAENDIYMPYVPSKSEGFSFHVNERSHNAKNQFNKTYYKFHEDTGISSETYNPTIIDTILDNAEYQEKDKRRPQTSNHKRQFKKKRASANNMEIFIALPPSLRTLRFDLMHLIEIAQTFRFGDNRLSSIIFSEFTKRLVLTGKMYGLYHLRDINFQGSPLKLDVEFFDTFPNLRTLSLRKTFEIPDFLQNNAGRLVQNILNLEYLDLAENSLHVLATNTFNTSKKLKYLCLASNRISFIPFSLRLTPSLEVLDMRWNSFVTISTEDRAAVDDHIQLVSNFTILFNHNELSCTCTNLPFLAWLQSHQKHFDQGGNYTCMSQDGTLSYTANYRDVDGFWRQCHGLNYFLTSLVLACALVAGYLAVFLGLKNRTQIVSKVMQLVVPGFRLKTRKDFFYDVCIGYADQDGLYVRDVLLRYIEDKWRLRTFVHQRDLLQDPLLMSKALRDSWRCLLLITDDFLHRYDMGRNVMKVASFFVSPSNPRSVVVMVEERVQHQIPDYVLQVVDEQNIIVLSDMRGFLDYEVKECLRTRLLN